MLFWDCPQGQIPVLCPYSGMVGSNIFIAAGNKFAPTPSVPPEKKGRLRGP
jgi:hypothetical protein